MESSGLLLPRGNDALSAEQQGFCSAGGAGSAGASPSVTAGAAHLGTWSPQQLGGLRQLPRLRSAPAQQTGVTGWLEGWRRLAEEQGCAVGRPRSTGSSSSECGSILPAPACVPLEPRPRSAPAVPALLQEPITSSLLAACNPLHGSLQAVAAPPPIAQFPSPFQSDMDSYASAAAAGTPPRGACSPEAVLARMQQQQVCGSLAAPPAAGGGSSEDSGASPLRSYSSPAGPACSTRGASMDDDLRSCRSFLSSLSCATQAPGPSACACCSTQEQHEQRLAASQQQQHGSSSLQYPSPPQPSRRSGLDGYRGAHGGAPADMPTGWADAGSALFGSPAPAARAAPRRAGYGVKRKSEDLPLPYAQPSHRSSEQLCVGLGERLVLRGGCSAPPRQLPRGSAGISGGGGGDREGSCPRPPPPPTADFTLSSFFSSGPAAAALPPGAPLDLSTYPHPEGPPASVAAATAAYTRREAAVLSQYMDALSAVELLGDAAAKEADELAFGDAELAAAAQAACGWGPASGAAAAQGQRLGPAPLPQAAQLPASIASPDYELDGLLAPLGPF